jgi:hypothetical protein
VITIFHTGIRPEEIPRSPLHAGFESAQIILPRDKPKPTKEDCAHQSAFGIIKNGH